MKTYRIWLETTKQGVLDIDAESEPEAQALAWELKDDADWDVSLGTRIVDTEELSS